MEARDLRADGAVGAGAGYDGSVTWAACRAPQVMRDVIRTQKSRTVGLEKRDA